MQNNNIVYDKDFEKIDFNTEKLIAKEYENCTFLNCDLSNCDLSVISFLECRFVSSDFSMAKINDTAFKDVVFVDCKLLGLRFDYCNNFLFSIKFENCQLDFSSFFKMKLKNTSFTKCSLVEVDFTEADLRNFKFDDCNLTNAVFYYSNLEKTDFRNSHGYVIDPEINKMKKAKFSLQGALGLLNKYNLVIE